MDNDPWVEYARLQAILDRTTDAYKAAGIEEAMADFLTMIECGEAICPKKLKNLVVNRVGKERRRRAIAYKRSGEIAPERPADDPAESRLMLAKCKEVCGERDFGLLLWKARGFTFDEISVHLGVNANTLKIQAFRARKQLTALAA